MTAPKEDAHELAERLLIDTREDIGRADAKASMLFGIAGVVLGVLLAGIVAGDWSPVTKLGDGEPLWWIGSACAIGGLICLGLAVYPAIGHPASHKEKVAYFGHVASFGGLDEFSSALAEYASKEHNDRAEDQVFQLSKIVLKKYKLVRAALILFALAGAFAAAGIAVG